MSVNPIILWPESWLNQKSVPVLPEEFNSEELAGLAEDLVDTMAAARGLGLAAPQLGVHKRVVAVPHPKYGVIVLCNPVLSEFTTSKQVTLEGCLSLPTITLPVERPTGVKVAAQRMDGTGFEEVWSGMAAIAVQHECDHLDGKTIADTVGPLRKQMIRKKLTKVVRDMRRAAENKEKVTRSVIKKVKELPTDPSEYAPPPKAAVAKPGP
jgi:peptide deformylase